MPDEQNEGFEPVDGDSAAFPLAPELRERLRIMETEAKERMDRERDLCQLRLNALSLAISQAEHNENHLATTARAIQYLRFLEGARNGSAAPPAPPYKLRQVETRDNVITGKVKGDPTPIPVVAVMSLDLSMDPEIVPEGWGDKAYFDIGLDAEGGYHLLHVGDPQDSEPQAEA